MIALCCAACGLASEGVVAGTERCGSQAFWWGLESTGAVLPPTSVLAKRKHVLTAWFPFPHCQAELAELPGLTSESSAALELCFLLSFIRLY